MNIYHFTLDDLELEQASIDKKIKNHLKDDITTDELISKYEKLIYKIINTLHIPSNKKEDYYDVGIIALITAYKRYDSNNSAKLSTFLYKTIKGEILKQLYVDNEYSEYNISFTSLEYNNDFDDESYDNYLESFGADKTDIELETIKKDYVKILMDLLNNTKYFKKRDKEIFMKYYGFSSEIFNSKELGEYYSLSSSRIRLIATTTAKKFTTLAREAIQKYNSIK